MIKGSSPIFGRSGPGKAGLLLLAGSILALTAGCSLGKEAQPPQPAPVQVKTGPEPGEETVPAPPKAPAGPTAPLTGLPVKEGALARPVMVMVNNAPQARPQSGLTEADMLLEVLAEGEITRLVAIYQSSVALQNPIGPVRSIRPYFIELGKSFGAIQVHAGGSPDGYAKLKREHIDDMDEITNAGPSFWREKSRKAPHNLYTSLEKIRAGAEGKGIAVAAAAGDSLKTPAYSFASGEAEAVPALGTGANGASADGTSLDVTFLVKGYKVGYRYDAGEGRYLRSLNGELHKDLATGTTLGAENVIVMGADHQVLDKEGRLDVKLTGSGEALFFQKGRAQSGEWRRDASGAPLRFTDGGKDLVLQPGRTHILIVPNAPTFASHVAYGSVPQP
ncbi:MULTISPECIES: DUF3048 domain-containing protein [Paenibacillus]|uniref:DUF3048 domain-containing protein n=1 Tax=Paenibacillus TaxID=44249 RepID=UPI0022B8A554|nr:DUF3048 domain-containing protein [Paenibacillus caseinilyticus]MCZ8519671.1 DUF3048 domain-containing protein [Paenibacillus caseinilyticus]